MRTTKLLCQELQSKQEMAAHEHRTSQSQIKIKGMEAKLSNLLETVLVSKLRQPESHLGTQRVTRSELRQEIDSLKQSLSEAQQAKMEATLAASLTGKKNT